MAKQQKQVRDLQEGSYVMIDDVACKINHYSNTATGLRTQLFPALHS